MPTSDKKTDETGVEHQFRKLKPHVSRSVSQSPTAIIPFPLVVPTAFFLFLFVPIPVQTCDVHTGGEEPGTRSTSVLIAGCDYSTRLTSFPSNYYSIFSSHRSIESLNRSSSSSVCMFNYMCVISIGSTSITHPRVQFQVASAITIKVSSRDHGQSIQIFN